MAYMYLGRPWCIQRCTLYIGILPYMALAKAYLASPWLMEHRDEWLATFWESLGRLEVHHSIRETSAVPINAPVSAMTDGAQEGHGAPHYSNYMGRKHCWWIRATALRSPVIICQLTPAARSHGHLDYMQPIYIQGTVKPVFKGHSDQWTPCYQGTIFQSDFVSTPCWGTCDEGTPDISPEILRCPVKTGFTVYPIVTPFPPPASLFRPFFCISHALCPINQHWATPCSLSG